MVIEITQKRMKERRVFTDNEAMINCSVHGPSTNAQNHDVHAEIEQQKKSSNGFQLLVGHLSEWYEDLDKQEFVETRKRNERKLKCVINR